MTYRNPIPTVDVIIQTDEGVVLISRRNPPLGWALPGGFVDYGESLEDAARREAKEETSVEVELEEQFLAYSSPARDPRRHVMSTTFIASIKKGELKAADDAVDIQCFPLDSLPTLCFDHKYILSDYAEYRRTGQRPKFPRSAP